MMAHVMVELTLAKDFKSFTIQLRTLILNIYVLEKKKSQLN